MTCQLTPDCPNATEGSTLGCPQCNRAARKAESEASKPVKLNARIKPVSDKRTIELKKYSALRRHYLDIHQICEVVGCCKVATDIHHQISRTNENLLDTNYFMAICRDHHIYYTANSKEAIEKGYSYARTGNLTNQL
jgi:hypothetical protein